MPETVTVNTKDLRAVLSAVTGAPHLIRELQAIRRLGENPIDNLINQLNAQMSKETDQDDEGEECPECEGSGFDDETGDICSMCDGDGEIV